MEATAPLLLGDLDIGFTCHTPTTGDAPFVTIQAQGRLTINASSINNNGDPDRIFDIHYGKIHFKNITISGGTIWALSNEARGSDHADDCAKMKT
ncbi:MAG: hypothetical protein HQM15_07610 [Deltaproteobacteria bacterium]|nr:hypothetical protein [Deltaproteobacteria bacterium]